MDSVSTATLAPALAAGRRANGIAETISCQRQPGLVLRRTGREPGWNHPYYSNSPPRGTPWSDAERSDALALQHVGR